MYIAVKLTCGLPYNSKASIDGTGISAQQHARQTCRNTEQNTREPSDASAINNQ